MNHLYILLLLTGISVKSQIFGVGYKQSEKGVFNAIFNYPFKSDDEDIRFNYSVGADFTTASSHMSTGINFNATAYYWLPKDIGLLALEGGYLINSGKGKNDFKISPYFYTDYYFWYLKGGYEYYPSNEEGYFFFSLGIGIGHRFTKFKMKMF